MTGVGIVLRCFEATLSSSVLVTTSKALVTRSDARRGKGSKNKNASKNKYNSGYQEKNKNESIKK